MAKRSQIKLRHYFRTHENNHNGKSSHSNRIFRQFANILIIPNWEYDQLSNCSNKNVTQCRQLSTSAGLQGNIILCAQYAKLNWKKKLMIINWPFCFKGKPYHGNWYDSSINSLDITLRWVVSHLHSPREQPQVPTGQGACWTAEPVWIYL
jgi:hypothetical protein